MSTLTSLLSLIKPDGSEPADISVLDADLDILDNAVMLTGIQTLSNKTLTSPTINSPTLTSPTVSTGGLTITAGGLTVTAGGVAVTAGNVGIGTAAQSGATSAGLTVAAITSGATSDYGVYINSPSGGGTNNEGLHVESALGPTFRVYAAGDVQVGTSNAMATSATAGFLAISACAGTPTGVPTQSAGRIPMIYDTTANKLWIYNGSWRSATFA